MGRIALITPDIATHEQHTLLHSLNRLNGYVPNLLRIVANSPAALRALIGLHSLAREGSLDLPTRERIAIALAQKNGSAYCLAAHTQLGSQAGLNFLSNLISKASRVDIDFPLVTPN